MNVAFFAKFRRYRIQEVRALRLAYLALEAVAERRLATPGLELHELKAMTVVRDQMRDAVAAAEQWLQPMHRVELIASVGEPVRQVVGDYGRRETESYGPRSASKQSHLIGPRDRNAKRASRPHERKFGVQS